MTKTLTCHIGHSASSYDIEIHRALLTNAPALSSKLKHLGSNFAIVTHPSIAALYGEAIQSAFSSNGQESHLLTFPSGEQHKTRETKELLENQMLEKGLGKQTCIIALGGGIVSDIAGYLAATYCRGVPFVVVPTSLLGMVDAGIGGKTGVNVPQGKNLIGCVYQPKKVLIDLSTLQSLPASEFRNGVVEMIKHSLILDASYFNYLEENASKLILQQHDVLEKAVYESCRIKKEVVQQDERDKGMRHLLNFGHTIGHALEKLSDYSLPHGEAVAIGILIEGHLAAQLGFLNKSDLERIFKLFTTYSLPLKLPFSLSDKTITSAMTADKKSLNGKPRFVILKSIGSAHSCNMQYCMAVDDKLITNAVHWMNENLAPPLPR